MGDPTKFLVVCGCSGSPAPVAYLDDDRATGGSLRVDAQADKMIVLAPALAGGEEPRDNPDAYTAMFTEHNVTRAHWNRWGEPRITWVIRCSDCGAYQVQMSHATYELVADRLAASASDWPLADVPAAHDDSLTEQRRMIPLGVLNLLVTELDG